MIYALNQLGFDISYEQIKQNAGGNIITRAHFANVLVQKNIVKNTKDAFDKYLSTDKPAYVQRQALSPALCIQTIQKIWRCCSISSPYFISYGLQ